MVREIMKDPIFLGQKSRPATAADLPIAYDECVKSGRIKQGDLVCFVGLGAGFHWGAVLYRQ